MPHGSWLLQTCSPSAALGSLAVVTTSLLILGYAASSSFLLGAPAYEYEDVVDAASAAVATVPRRGAGYPPVLAYYISGGHGDSVWMTRLLKAVYHPRNRYLLHLDAGASAYERARLAGYARSERAFLEYGNVHVVGKGDPVDGRGASAVAVRRDGRQRGGLRRGVRRRRRRAAAEDRRGGAGAPARRRYAG